MAQTTFLDTGMPPRPAFTFTPIDSTGTVVQTKMRVGGIQHYQLTLTNFVISVSDSSGEYGGSSLGTMPDKNIIILNAEANLTVVKGNATNGIGAGDGIDMGVGTAVASNNTLSTTMQNIIPKTSISTSALSVSFQATTFSATGTAVLLAIPEGSASIYLNGTTTGGGLMSADDTLTVTGTIDFWVLEVGNITS